MHSSAIFITFIVIIFYYSARECGREGCRLAYARRRGRAQGSRASPFAPSVVREKRDEVGGRNATELVGGLQPPPHARLTVSAVAERETGAISAKGHPFFSPDTHERIEPGGPELHRRNGPTPSQSRVVFTREECNLK